MGRGGGFKQWLRERYPIMDEYLCRQLRYESEAVAWFTWDVARHIQAYRTHVNGYCLSFIILNNPFGERAYRLNDSLAKVLGFGDIQRLKAVLPIRKSRRFLTIPSLQRAINRYALRASGLQAYPRERHKRPRKPQEKKNINRQD